MGWQIPAGARGCYCFLTGLCGLSGTENRHKAIQKSHAEMGFRSGLRPPLAVSGSEKS
jgi:hypothetical protein